GTLGFLAPGTDSTVGGLAGSTNLVLSSLNPIPVGNNNASTAYTGNLSGAAPAGLIKIGTGTWTLGGTNTFSGPFNVQAGTVVVGAAGALSPNAPANISLGAPPDLNGCHHSLTPT